METLSAGPGDPTGSSGSRSPHPPSTTVRAQATGGDEDGGNGKCGNESIGGGRGTQNGKDVPRGQRNQEEDATFFAQGGRATQGLEDVLAFPRRGRKVVDVPQALLGLVPYMRRCRRHTAIFGRFSVFPSRKTFQYHRSGSMCSWYSALWSCLHCWSIDYLAAVNASVWSYTLRRIPPLLASSSPPYCMYLESLLISSDAVIGQSCKTRL